MTSAGVSERTVRVLLRWGEGRRLHVRTEIDGSPVLPDEEIALGRDFASSYLDFLALYSGDLGELGTAVGNAVFPGAHGAAVAALLAVARQRGEGVRLVFETGEPDLLALPFEAARLPSGLVAALEPGVRVLRRHARAIAPPLVSTPGPLRVLAAVGAPDEGETRNPVLDYESELQTIFDAVDRARRKGRVEIEVLEVGHPREIQKALEEQSFHILHLSGHGGAGAMVLEDEDGGEVVVQAKDLAAAIRATGRPLPLVVLASCLSGAGDSETASLAQGLLEAGIPAVLAMQTSVSDWYATRLAGAFYEHLAQLEVPLPSHALALARQEVERERQRVDPELRPAPEYATPALFCGAEESPLLDRRAAPQALSSPRPRKMGGPVPLLRIGELVGRRRELRQALRVLRDDPRSIEAVGRRAGVALLGIGGVGKSALAGRVMGRLTEDGWHVAVVEGRWSLGELAKKVGASLVIHPDGELSRLGGFLLQEGLADEARLQILGTLLAGHRVLLVLDNFEDNLTLAGTAFLDSTLGTVLDTLYRSAESGKILITCRYRVPGSEDWLASLDVGPLSPSETRKLFQRLPGLRDQDAATFGQLLRLLGGHPRMLEYLDAILRRGKARLPGVAERLRENAAKLGVRVETLGGDFEASVLDALRIGAQDILLDELLAILAVEPGDREALEQAAVFPMPVEAAGLAFALGGAQEASAEQVEFVRRVAERLVRTSLLTPVGNDLFFVHRWTAEALKGKMEDAAYRECCRRAGESLVWRVSNVTHYLEDGIEGTRLLLRAEAFDRAVGEAGGILSFMQKYGQSVDIVAFSEEILGRLPELHDAYPGVLGAGADALWTLGVPEAAIEGMRKASQLLDQHAKAEPNRIDYQRELSVSYNKLGSMLRDLGQGQDAEDFYRKDLKITERLTQAEPNSTDYQRDLSISYNNLGDLLRGLGQIQDAEGFYRNSLDIIKRLAQNEPNRADYQRDLSVSFERMGDLLRDLGQRQGAEGFYRNSLDIRKQLAQDEPNRADYRRDLSISYNKLGDLLREFGQRQDAEGFYRNSLDIRRQLAQDEPNLADYQVNLASSFRRMAHVEPQEALVHLELALAILKTLQEKGSLLPIHVPKLHDLEEEIAELQAGGTWLDSNSMESPGGD